MPGTKEGGAKTAATNKRKFGDDYYARIGAIGGKKSNNVTVAKNKGRKK
jgi:hypothetical protein